MSRGTLLINTLATKLCLTPNNSALQCLKHSIPFLFFEVLKVFDMRHMGNSFHSHEVVALTGITARQLQWWDEQGIVVPARAGHCRLYSEADLAEVAVLCSLRKKGFSLQRVRKVMGLLQREFGKRLADTVTGASEYHLLTDGERVYLETSHRQIVDILKNSRQPIFGICVSDEVRRIRADIRARKAAASSPPRSPARSKSVRSAVERPTAPRKFAS
jgi:DNA-binding transcriptional MerR regulator